MQNEMILWKQVKSLKPRKKQLLWLGGCNGGMKAKELREYCDMNRSTKDLLKSVPFY